MMQIVDTKYAIVTYTLILFSCSCCWLFVSYSSAIELESDTLWNFQWIQIYSQRISSGHCIANPQKEVSY